MEVIPLGDEYIYELLESIDEAINDPTNMALPDPSVVTYFKDFSQRRIWLNLNVSENVFEFVRNIIQWNTDDKEIPAEERKPIWLYIFNYGGSADLMWMLTDVIAQSITPIYTVNMGQCASAAALIFMSGHKRFMMPSSTVLIHEGSGQIEGDAVKVLDQAASYKAMVKRMHNYILAHTGIPPATLNKKRNNDWELDSETCLKYGVCDCIINSLNDII